MNVHLNSHNNTEAEFEGNTVEEAISKAERTLGLLRENMEIKIVCEEKRGLFGMVGSKQAKIRVVVKM
ncbi:MAG: Jag N-terminal domain-containing protein [Candidatus Omnitrophica bacterium]|nr:Jag N-terminal domain-containing protein [Candidatus Omnitrophota bacterium]